MEQLRLFIAIELDDALRGALKRAQKQIEDECNRVLVAKNGVRWVAPENIHLTLKFLGNAKRAQIPTLQNVLERAAQSTAPFELYARGVGCFPNAHRPNNVWVGLEGDVERAALLTQRIEAECAAVGFAREARGFTPHLTLGRVKRDASNSERAALGAMIKNKPPESYGVIHARAVYLIASDLRPSGPVYTVLAENLFAEDSTP
ncbi:MAG: RNA 2',3'-cyclic phosphodiesterase [Chloroflexi bacterium]|nr:RNA 2',3'-cyclic phosphodiesterase [Chloroflexota bacterium]